MKPGRLGESEKEKRLVFDKMPLFTLEHEKIEQAVKEHRGIKNNNCPVAWK